MFLIYSQPCQFDKTFDKVENLFIGVQFRYITQSGDQLLGWGRTITNWNSQTDRTLTEDSYLKIVVSFVQCINPGTMDWTAIRPKGTEYVRAVTSLLENHRILIQKTTIRPLIPTYVAKKALTLQKYLDEQAAGDKREPDLLKAGLHTRCLSHGCYSILVRTSPIDSALQKAFLIHYGHASYTFLSHIPAGHAGNGFVRHDGTTL